MGTRSVHRPAYRNLCEQLHGLRLSADLTQRALGAKLGKPHTYVAKVEHGSRRIDPVEFVEWCNACGAKAGREIDRIKV